eukprot:392175-Prorocentrum_minimum.AAC.8
MMCVGWYTSVDSRRQSTVELKSKALFLAVDCAAWLVGYTHPVAQALAQLRVRHRPPALRRATLLQSAVHLCLHA